MFFQDRYGHQAISIMKTAGPHQNLVSVGFPGAYAQSLEAFHAKMLNAAVRVVAPTDREIYWPPDVIVASAAVSGVA
jgi:hypothetical protein